MNLSETDDAIAKSLAAAHSAVNAKHDQGRDQLLQSLPDVSAAPQAAPTGDWRFVVGGVGLSAVAATILLSLWLFGSTSPAVAMERMAAALDQVTSYSFRMESIYVLRKEQGRTVRHVIEGSWQTQPVGLHATAHVVETLGTSTLSPSEPKALVHVEEVHQAGRRGIIIDHLEKEYWWIDEELDADSIGNPLVLIYMVRQRRGRVARDLGLKKIDGRMARGLVMVLDDEERASELGPVSASNDTLQVANWEWRNVEIEAWVDSTSNLPIEFHCTRRGDDESETSYRFADLKWKVEFAAETFDPVAPEGYRELEASPWAEEE